MQTTEILNYQGYNGLSHCLVRLYTNSEIPIAIVSDIDHGGTSSVNAIKTVIEEITAKYKLRPDIAQFYHYDSQHNSCTKRETFHIVPFTWKGNAFELNNGGEAWKKISRDDMEASIGTHFE